jgi:ribonuclease R
VSGKLEEAPKVRRGGKPAKVQIDEAEAWEAAGVHCSGNERRADEASRDVEAWLKCRYMRERLGEEFSGTVSAVTSFGLFVQLDALYVEGLVHITELGGEYYRFDEARQELRGERTGIRYTVGARVRVQVSRVDLDGRKIDFRMVREGEGDRLPSRTMRDKTGARADGSASDELAAVRKADRAAKAGAKRGSGGKSPRGERVGVRTGTSAKKASKTRSRRR